MQNYDLHPQYDSRASFYGKATVNEHGNVKELTSYSTHVATIIGAPTNKAYVFGTYSQTTSRHTKEFLRQNGFRADNSKQIMADYGADKEQPEAEKPDMFKNVAAVMALGEVLAPNQAQANDWKLRMLKAGFENHGLIMPDNWNELDEAEKQRRLDNVITEFKE